MRGILTKRIHSFQAGMPGMTWPRAKRLWSSLMDNGAPGPIDTITPRQRRRRASTIWRPKVAKYGISTCAHHGVSRPLPHTKICRRKLLSQWRRATIAERASPVSGAAAAFREVIDRAAAMLTKAGKTIGRVFRRPQGRGR